MIYFDFGAGRDLRVGDTAYWFGGMVGVLLDATGLTVLRGSRGSTPRLRLLRSAGMKKRSTRRSHDLGGPETFWLIVAQARRGYCETRFDGFGGEILTLRLAGAEAGVLWG